VFRISLEHKIDSITHSVARSGARKVSLSCCSDMSAEEERFSTRIVARASDPPDASKGFGEDVTELKLFRLLDPKL